VATQLGLDEPGYRLVANHGADANQIIFHFHVHILGGRHMSGAGGKPRPGDGT
jgi:histidine triad (HIT) family protein